MLGYSIAVVVHCLFEGLRDEMSLFFIFWIRCHFLLYTKTKGDKDVMIKKITVKGNSVIVHISTKSKTELTFLMR